MPWATTLNGLLNLVELPSDWPLIAAVLVALLNAVIAAWIPRKLHSDQKRLEKEDVAIRTEKIRLLCRFELFELSEGFASKAESYDDVIKVKKRNPGLPTILGKEVFEYSNALEKTESPFISSFQTWPFLLNLDECEKITDAIRAAGVANRNASILLSLPEAAPESFILEDVISKLRDAQEKCLEAAKCIGQSRKK